MPRLNPFAWGSAKLAKAWETGIDGHVVSVSWSAPLGLIAAASVDGPIVLLDAKTGEARRQLAGHGFGTACAIWSPDGRRLASAGQDGKVRLWDAATGKATHEMPGGAPWVEGLAWCPQPRGGEGLLASAAGKKLRLWNLDGTMVREYPGHPSTIADIKWKPNDAVLASTAYGKLFLWSPEQQAPVREFAWQGSMLALAWSPNGHYIAAGAQDCSVHFWLMSSGEDLQMTGYPVKVRELAWDAGSRYLATGGGPVPTVWDTSGDGPANTEPLQFEAHKDNLTCLEFQRKGGWLASGGEDGLVALWSPGKQKGALALAKHGSAVSVLQWSGDDRKLVAGTAGGDVVMYSTN